MYKQDPSFFWLVPFKQKVKSPLKTIIKTFCSKDKKFQLCKGILHPEIKMS